MRVIKHYTADTTLHLSRTRYISTAIPYKLQPGIRKLNWTRYLRIGMQLAQSRLGDLASCCWIQRTGAGPRPPRYIISHSAAVELSPNVRKAADEGVHVGARGVQSLWGCSGRDLQSRHHRDATVRAEPVQRHQLTASTESRPVSPHTVPSDTSSLPVQSRDPLDPTRSRSALPPPQRQGDKAMFYNRPTVQLTSLTVSCDLQY